jgi:hypothetical protein
MRSFCDSIEIVFALLISSVVLKISMLFIMECLAKIRLRRNGKLEYYSTNNYEDESCGQRSNVYEKQKYAISKTYNIKKTPVFRLMFS